MIEGLVLWVIALAIIFATPAARQIDARRQVRPPIAQQIEQALPPQRSGKPVRQPQQQTSTTPKPQVRPKNPMRPGSSEI